MSNSPEEERPLPTPEDEQRRATVLQMIEDNIAMAQHGEVMTASLQKMSEGLSRQQATMPQTHTPVVPCTISTPSDSSTLLQSPQTNSTQLPSPSARPPRPPVAPTSATRQTVSPTSRTRSMGQGLQGSIPLYSEGHRVRLEECDKVGSTILKQLCCENPDMVESRYNSEDGFPRCFLRQVRNSADARPLNMPDIPIGTEIISPFGSRRMVLDQIRQRRTAIQVLEAEITGQRVVNLHNTRTDLRTFQCLDAPDVEFTTEMQVALRSFTGTLFILERYGPAITVEGIIKTYGATWGDHLKWMGRIDDTGNPIRGADATGRYDNYRTAFQAVCYWADHHERTICALAGPLAHQVVTFSPNDYNDMCSAFTTYVIILVGKIHAGKRINPSQIRQRYMQGITDELQDTIDEHLNSFIQRKYNRTGRNRRPLQPRG
ncbi:unnamed protein product [Trypanosoma congolense IL3000]|uniref:WGS project CAEQ00000000 data, annotated contig 933 n=1 Tax=Trypanosoma congolense (strain IL3000) TaxID=1068625 RepID=F9WJN7_TRYCI|nr:unnamed protein product [Trypanosoma congolense IL3000]